MSAPSLQAYVNGVGQTSADNMNTFVQSCDDVADLRDFNGLPGIQVYIRGISTIDDGGQGNFYWNAGVTNPVDDGVNTIVPNGSSSGCWSRVSSSNINALACSATGANAIVLSPLNGVSTITSYENYQLFTYIAPGTSTGNVTVQYTDPSISVSLLALPLFLPNGSQVGSGGSVAGGFNEIAYISSLNSGGDGFLILNSPATSSGSGSVNTGTINNLAYYSATGNVVSGTTAIPNGTTATTQTASDNSTKLATTAYIDRGSSGASEVLLGTMTASGSSSIAFTAIPSGYDQYEIRFTNIIPSTNGSQLQFQVGNPSLLTSNYSWTSFESSDSSGSGAHGSTSASAFILTSGGISSTATIGTSGKCSFAGLSSANQTQITGQALYFDGSGSVQASFGGRQSGAAGPFTVISAKMSSGNIASGVFSLYAIRNS